jgi:predicted CXXCH cytochrome family protein
MPTPSELWASARQAYERPTQDWACGRETPCSAGPNRKRGCGGTARCVPSTEADVYLCARAQEDGGACEVGPGTGGSCGSPLPPCIPVPSLRIRRRRTSLAVGGLAFAFTVLVWYSLPAQPLAARLFSPGPLARAHADIESDCASCHTALSDSSYVGDLAWDAFRSSGNKGGPTECGSCHEVPEALTFLPHTLAVASSGSGSLSAHLAPGGADPRSCASCHVEHGGAGAELRPDPAELCASCHLGEPESFKAAHPSLEPFAILEDELRWAFDHTSHSVEYYPREEEAFDCVVCHNAGQVLTMAVNTFEASCTSCHNHVSEVNSVRLPVFQLPGLDYETLEEEGLGMGSWPEDAGIDLEAELTPATRLLLDAEGVRAADRLEAQGALLFDLLDADVELADVETLVWSLKEALADVREREGAALRSRLGRWPGVELTRDLNITLQQWAEALNRASGDWFPDLEAEVARHDAGESVEVRVVSDYDFTAEEVGAWTVDTRTFSVHYSVERHADALARALFEAAAGRASMAGLMTELRHDAAAGSCLKCHGNGLAASADWLETGGAPSEGPEASTSVAGWFDHGPHLSVTTCAECHAETGATPSFDTVPLSLCSACHATEPVDLEEPATMTCSACHVYHDAMSTKAIGTDSATAPESGG